MRKALRVTPGGNAKGTATNPGRKSRRGRSARRATSTPAMIEQLRKRRLSLASGIKSGRMAVGGKSDRMIHSERAEATKPIGKSSFFQYAIMSQTPRKRMKRTIETVIFD